MNACTIVPWTGLSGPSSIRANKGLGQMDIESAEMGDKQMQTQESVLNLNVMSKWKPDFFIQKKKKKKTLKSQADTSSKLQWHKTKGMHT